jgi:hypothetical protein
MGLSHPLPVQVVSIKLPKIIPSSVFLGFNFLHTFTDLLEFNIFQKNYRQKILHRVIVDDRDQKQKLSNTSRTLETLSLSHTMV